MKTKTITEEQLNRIDDILCTLEDYTHGKDGAEITKVRGMISDISQQFQSAPKQEVTDEMKELISAIDMIHEDLDYSTENGVDNDGIRKITSDAVRKLHIKYIDIDSTTPSSKSEVTDTREKVVGENQDENWNTVLNYVKGSANDKEFLSAVKDDFIITRK